MKEVFEIFGEPSRYQLDLLGGREPSCINGNVRVKKYRVTVEEVNESESELHGRIQDMWNNCDNSHHWGPLRREAKKYGLELNHETRR